MLEFKRLELSDKTTIDDCIKNFPVTSSELNFTTFYIWRDLLNVEFTITNGCVIFKTKHNQNPMALRFPLGFGDKTAAINNCLLQYGEHTRFYGLTEDMNEYLIKEFPGVFEISEMEDYFDYVYETEKLISLSGKKLHGKRNHINTFYKLYNCKFYPITKQDAEFITEYYNKWYEASDDEYLLQEKKSIKDLLKNFDYLGLMGAKLLVGDELAAFTIGERLNVDTAVVHIEKANTDYKGSYTVINQHFCEQFLADYKYVNREEDMGLAGLRKAKQSYYPDKLIKKYKATRVIL